MYVVLGATGHTGSVAAGALLDAGKKVRVVARDAKKLEPLVRRGAEAATASMESADDLTRVFEGAEGAYVLFPPDPTSADFLARARRIADAVATALERTKVPHVVLLSSVGAQHEAGTGPVRTVAAAEKRFAKLAGTRFTFLRAAYFMENLLANLHPMKTDGVLPTFNDETVRFDMVATADIGAEVARALLSPPAKTEVVELSGPAPKSITDAAAAFSAALGKPIKTVRAPYDAVVPTLTGFGFSENVAGLYREMIEGIDQGLLAFDGTGRRVRGATSLEAFATKSVG